MSTSKPVHEQLSDYAILRAHADRDPVGAMVTTRRADAPPPVDDMSHPPVITIDHVQKYVKSTEFHTSHNLTVCIVHLHNGVQVTGESYVQDMKSFNAETGRRVARDRAMATAMQLVVFHERERWRMAQTPPVMRCKLTVSGVGPSVRPAAGAAWNPETQCYDRVELDGVMANMNAVYASGDDGKNAVVENRVFGDATPYASLQMHVRNGQVIHELRQGREFYVDFTPAETTA